MLCGMPTIARFPAFRVMMFPNDHNPPHVHLIGNEVEAVVQISTGTVLQGDARRCREGVTWIVENRDMLLRRWRELNEER